MQELSREVFLQEQKSSKIIIADLSIPMLFIFYLDKKESAIVAPPYLFCQITFLFSK
jgi:hypothetical protein